MHKISYYRSTGTITEARSILPTAHFSASLYVRLLMSYWEHIVQKMSRICRAQLYKALNTEKSWIFHGKFKKKKFKLERLLSKRVYRFSQVRVRYTHAPLYYLVPVKNFEQI